jgi:hypothetical protein
MLASMKDFTPKTRNAIPRFSPPEGAVLVSPMNERPLQPL